MIELSFTEDNMARLAAAGDTYNTAVYLRRELPDADNSVAYVSALGDDPMSQRIMAALGDEGIDTGKVETRPGMSCGLYAISIDDEGERSFSYWRSASAARTLFAAPCEVTLNCLMGFDMLFLSGISIAILPQEVRDNLYRQLEAFRNAGGLVAFDSNYRAKLWESVEVARRQTMAMWARCDIALPSLDDEMELFGETSQDQVLQRLYGAGIRFGAMKRGPLGPIALDGHPDGLHWDIVEDVVDTTAAGDSFNAGFLAARAQGQSIDICMMKGHRLSSEVIRHKGAIIPRQ